MIKLVKYFTTSFKSRMIIIFSIITILLVGIFSRTAYYYVKKFHLAQVEEQVQMMVSVIATDLDSSYLSLIPASDQKSTARQLYNDYLSEKIKTLKLYNGFIFDDKLRLIVHTDTGLIVGIPYSSLMLNRKEIAGLAPGGCITSLPFKSEDDHWYMWGFYRINSHYWLGVQENVSRLNQVEQISSLFWLIGLTGVIITIIAGWILGKTIARPIDQLVRFSRTIGDGDYSIPLPKSGLREIKVLVSALDKMRNNIIRNQEEKEKILAQIAHEIRNPLGGIELLTGLIKEDLVKQDGDITYPEKILKEISILKAQITAYLNYSRPAAPSPVWVSVETLIEDARAFINSGNKNILLKTALEPLMVWFDPTHLRQIIMNLIANSIALVEENSTIKLSLYLNHYHWYLTVSDEGPGIPADNLETVFQPFYTTQDGGTGLGLAISRKLCQENNAVILVKNNEKKGCTFYIKGNKYRSV